MALKYGLFVSIVIACSAASANGTAAVGDWTWTKSSKLCAGVRKTCTSVATCTDFAIGPCPKVDAPTRYIKSSFVGMGFVDESKYLLEKSTENAKLLDPSGIGYRDGGVVEAGGAKYAYGMAGNIFGNLSSAGGYLGLAHYLNTGDKDITTKVNDIYTATSGSTSRVDRSSSGGSKYGAPEGPYKVCISDVTAGECGAERTFKPNEYKFSIFGHFSGDDYNTSVVAGSNGFPSTMTDMGVRMKLEGVGFQGSDLQINGRVYDQDKVNENVKSFSFKTKSGGINFEFPTKYNTGSTHGALTDGTMLSVSETKTMKIRIHSVEKGSLMIDYLFDVSSLAQGQYVIYDPSVTAVEEDSSSSLGKDSGGNCIAVPMLAAFVCALASMNL